MAATVTARAEEARMDQASMEQEVPGAREAREDEAEDEEPRLVQGMVSASGVVPLMESGAFQVASSHWTSAPSALWPFVPMSPGPLAKWE